MIKRIAHAVRVLRSKLRERQKAKRRSPHWAALRDAFLKTHPLCSACGGNKNLQVHHRMPFSVHPELELVASNLITLCMGKYECHDRIGHGDDWRYYNPAVATHAAIARGGNHEQAAQLARLNRKGP